VAAIFVFIAGDFGQNVSGLGFLTASLYVGLGIFQIPGGIIAAKQGPRRVAFYGMLISSVASFFTGFTSEFSQLIILRFLVGIGLALFFASGVTLIAKSFGQSGGFGVGLFNGAFYLGSSLGIVAWTVLAELIGWRSSLAISGALGICGAFLLLSYVPKDELREDFVVKMLDLRRVLSDKWLVVLSLELFGFVSGSILITTFTVFYLEQSLKLSPVFAGSIGSLTPLFAVFTSPVMGMLYDRMRRARLLVLSSGLGLAASLALVAVGNVYSAILATIVVGVCTGCAFTVSYLSAREAQATSAEYETLAISWVNCTQMFAGFWSPITFSLLVVSFGYAASWLTAAGYTFLLILVILLVKEPIGKISN
jgi:MFS family permease